MIVFEFTNVNTSVEINMIHYIAKSILMLKLINAF